MNVASIQKLAIEFGGDLLFSDVTFDINEGDFVGLIGANGTGKTTIFKIITGELEPTEGGVYISNDKKIGYLEQHACSNSTRTVYDEALSVFSYLVDIEKELEEIGYKLNSEASDRNSLIEMQDYLQNKYNSEKGLTFRSLTSSALVGLGFSKNDFDTTCDKLSGGQRAKLSMCKLLLSDADLLLLDEPTNHLDISGSEWLENYLLSYRGSVLVISHDRYFLDSLCNKIVEISNKRSYTSNGNYSSYYKKRQERIEIERRNYENQLEEIKRIEGIIEQQRSFARERNFITAESKRKMLEKKKAELVEPEPDISEMRVSFAIESETGNDVLFVKNLVKSFGQKELFKDASFEVYRKERAFILGRNGCGKTTILRILTGQIPQDSGSFYFGSNVKIAYFDQNLGSLRGHKTVIDEVWDEHRLFKETEVRKYLALFLFKGNDVFKNVDNLSGGEKAKLCLLKLMLSGANVLLLDEPTNHLDIISREVLENALAEFDGTIIAVSHDRYFINKLSDKILVLDEHGVSELDGNYDDYCRKVKSEPVVTAKKDPKPNSYKLKKELNSEINRLTGKIKRTEEQIDSIDNEINEANEKLSDPANSSDYELILGLTAQISELNEKQSLLMNEWETMNSQLSSLLEERNESE